MLRCPNCGDTDSLQIVVQVWVVVMRTEDGLESEINDPNHEWDEASPVQCGECGHVGPAKPILLD